MLNVHRSRLGQSEGDCNDTTVEPANGVEAPLDLDGFCNWMAGVLSLEVAPTASASLILDLAIDQFLMFELVIHFDHLVAGMARPRTNIYRDISTVRDFYLHYLETISRPLDRDSP